VGFTPAVSRDALISMGQGGPILAPRPAQ
jgi:hypothetical protein